MREKAIIERDEKFQEYLKTESKRMINQWENSKEALRNKTQEEKIQREKERLKDLEVKYKTLMENDDKLRKEKLEKSQDMTNKLKPGPKQLESAAVYAEVLRSRDAQIKSNEEKRKNDKLKRIRDGQQDLCQAQQWMSRYSDSMNENSEKRNKYKCELFKVIKTEEQKRQEIINKENEMERIKREASDKEIREQMERERMILERKKEAMRKNALEAMIMVEQRRKRDLQIDAAENKLIAAYAEGKDKLKKIQRDTINDRRKKEIHMKQSIAEQIYRDESEQINAENARIKKEEKEITEKMMQREKEKMEYAKKMKAERIEAHLRDVEWQKQLKAQKEQDFMWDKANRLKNVEVSLAYEQEKKNQKLKELNSNRTILLQQIDERVKRQREEKAIDDHEFAKNENKAEDDYFFAYANELIDDAIQKGRPVLPLRRVIGHYKTLNRLHGNRECLPHLKSNVPISKDCKFCSPIKYDIDELKMLDRQSP